MEPFNPKEGDLLKNKNDNKIYRVKNFHQDRRGYPWFWYYECNPSTNQEAEVGTPARMPLNPDAWRENWEPYVSSGSGGGSSSVSTPKKKSQSENAPNTVKRPPERVPPLPLRSNPQYKEGSVMTHTSGGSNEQRRLFQQNSRAYRSGPHRQHRAYMSSDDEDDLGIETGPSYETQEQAVNRNLRLPNGRWILSRDFNGNSGSKRIEINQEVIVIGQRSSAQTGGPALVICKYKSFQTGQLRMVRGAIRKDFFIDGTFIFRAWGLNISDDPPNPPSYEAAERQRELREDFGFFKNNINIKF